MINSTDNPLSDFTTKSSYKSGFAKLLCVLHFFIILLSSSKKKKWNLFIKFLGTAINVFFLKTVQDVEKIEKT